MSAPEPVERVPGRTLRRLLWDPVGYALGLVAGASAGAAAAGSGAVDAWRVAAGVGAGVGCLVLTAYVARARSGDAAEVRFYPDRVAVDRAGPLAGTAAVSYDDIELAVKREGGPTASYALVTDGGAVPVANAADPPAFERALDSRVPSPRERNQRLAPDASGTQTDEAAETGTETADGPDRPIAAERPFWRWWPTDRPLPVSVLVPESGLPEPYRSSDAPHPEGESRESPAGRVGSGATNT